MPVWASKAHIDKRSGDLSVLESRMGAGGHRPDYLDEANRAGALLYMGRLKEALEHYTRANVLSQIEIDQRYGPEKSWSSYNHRLAAIHLLLGDAVSATRELREEIKMLKERPLAFTDAAGGVDPGLLLWYVARRERDGAVEEEALKYLRRVLKTRRGRNNTWPRRLAEFVLGDITFNQMLTQEFHSTDLNDLEKRANDDKPPPRSERFLVGDPRYVPTGSLLRAELARALFYGAVKVESLDLSGSRSLLRRCTRLRDVDLECEWYLAFLHLGLFP